MVFDVTINGVTKQIESTRLSIDDRRWLCTYHATLSGMPANICGAAEPFAMVRELVPPHRSVQVSWLAVITTINQRAGKFR